MNLKDSNKDIPDNVLAIDPGRKKCGIAVINNEMKLVAGKVIDKEELIKELKFFLEKYTIKDIAIGGGTNSQEIFEIVTNHFSDIRLTTIIEKDSTMLARKEYFHYNPPRGWLKLIPASLRIPPCPYDDFAAYIIARRFLLDYRKDTGL